MAIGFNDVNGSAKKSEVTYMKLNEGDNTFRILPNSFLPSYTYWVKGANGKDLPFESLQFDRDTERFDNTRACPVKSLGLKDPKDDSKDLRCGWSYKCLVINKSTNKVEVLQLKKGIVEGIKDVGSQMGIDITDPETGTWITVKKAKTGPHVFNVEYSVQQLKCSSEALSDEHKKLIEDAKPIDELFPVESYDAQMLRLRKHLDGAPKEEEAQDNTDQEAVDDLES